VKLFTVPAILFGATAAVLAQAPAGAPVPRAPQPQPQVQDTGQVRLRLASTGNEARYRVNEQLARLTLPNDAVGATTAITGQLLLVDGGRFVRDSSRISIDLGSLRTDSDRRDNYVRRRTLEVEQYPTAVLTATSLRGLPWPLPTSGQRSFQLVGDLDLHGVTRPTTWEVTAQFAGRRITGTARTHFKFGDFNMQIPRVASVLSVQDSIRLEYDFAFEIE
jgi:polyisoprenoid-binding protein YceI